MSLFTVDSLDDSCSLVAAAVSFDEQNSFYKASSFDSSSLILSSSHYNVLHVSLYFLSTSASLEDISASSSLCVYLSSNELLTLVVNSSLSQRLCLSTNSCC
ncbi:hypothetical protein Hanom_Chr06g00543811 [Helianthus anomalus]